MKVHRLVRLRSSGPDSTREEQKVLPAVPLQQEHLRFIYLLLKFVWLTRKIATGLNSKQHSSLVPSDGLCGEFVGLSSDGFIAFQSCSKHAALTLRSRFCPSALLSTPQRKPARPTRAPLASDEVSFFVSHHLPMRARLPPHPRRSLKNRQRGAAPLGTAHRMANSTSGCLLLPVSL